MIFTHKNPLYPSNRRLGGFRYRSGFLKKWKIHLKCYLIVTNRLSVGEMDCLYLVVCFWSRRLIPFSKKLEVSTDILKIFENPPWEINPLNAELNPICRLLALLEAHRILHVSMIRVKDDEIPRTFVAVLCYGGHKFSLSFTETILGIEFF